MFCRLILSNGFTDELEFANLSGLYDDVESVPCLPLISTFCFDIVPADAVTLAGAEIGFHKDRLHQVTVLQPDFSDHASVPRGLKMPVHKEGHQACPLTAQVAYARVVDVKMQRGGWLCPLSLSC